MTYLVDFEHNRCIAVDPLMLRVHMIQLLMCRGDAIGLDHEDCPKMGDTPKSFIFCRIFPKPTILGYPHFKKTSMCLLICTMVCSDIIEASWILGHRF